MAVFFGGGRIQWGKKNAFLDVSDDFKTFGAKKNFLPRTPPPRHIFVIFIFTAILGLFSQNMAVFLVWSVYGPDSINADAAEGGG